MTGNSHELVMRYHDGELDEDEVRELERQLASDPEAARVLAGLEQLGDVVRSLSLSRAEAASDIADSVMSKIAAEDVANDAPARVAPPAPRWSFPAVAAALAAAAAVALWLARPPEPSAPVARTPVPAVVPPAPAEPVIAPAPEIEAEDLASAAEIESVDFGSHNGAIFLVSAGAETTPVVWLSDESAPSADPTESL